MARRKSSMIPIPIVKQPSAGPVTEFRWSISAALSEENTSSNVPLINLESFQEKAFVLSSTLTDRNSICRSSVSIQKMPHLVNLNDVNKKRKLSDTTNQDNQERTSPLLLTYSQLHHAQINQTTRKRVSNDTRSNASRSSSLSTDKYVRLPTTQLRRLHVSEKYMKEAKKLYFNAASKSFVPRLSIVQVL